MPPRRTQRRDLHAPWTAWLGLGLMLIATAGCDAVLGLDRFGRGIGEAGAGGGTVTSGVGAAPAVSGSGAGTFCPQEANPGPWEEPSAVFPGASEDDDDPAITADGLQLFFERSSDVWSTRRAALGAPWSAPAEETGIDWSGSENDVAVSPDGLTVFFSDNDEIYRTQRLQRNGSWSLPVLMDLGDADRIVGITADGAWLIAAATCNLRQFQRLATGQWGLFRSVDELSGTCDAWMSPDGLVVLWEDGGTLWQAERTDVEGFFGLERTTRLDIVQEPPLGDPVGRPDSCELFAARDRPGGGQELVVTRRLAE